MAADRDELLERLQQARATVESRAAERARLTGRRDAYLQEVEQFKMKLRAEGIEPANLDQLVEQAETDLLAKLTQLEANLNAQTATN